MPIELTKDFVVASLSDSSVQIYFHGATLTSWKSHAHERIFLSSKAILDGSKAIRGGIPIVFPQFGIGPQSPTVSHGFARNSKWTWLGIQKETTTDILVSFSLEDSEETLKAWNHKFKLIYNVHLFSNPHKLKTELEIRNTGGSPFNFTCLLHTYFNLANGIEHVHVTGLGDYQSRDKTKANEIENADKHHGTILFKGQVDKTFINVTNNEVHVKGVVGGLCKIEKNGFNDVVVWNPGKELAAKMPDLMDDFDKMVCVEVGNVENEITLAPGTNFIASQILH